MDNNFEKLWTDEDEKEIKKIEAQKIKDSDEFKEKGIRYKRKPAHQVRLTNKRAEEIIAAMEQEKAEAEAKRQEELAEERRREIERSRADQKDDINDLYR